MYSHVWFCTLACQQRSREQEGQWKNNTKINYKIKKITTAGKSHLWWFSNGSSPQGQHGWQLQRREYWRAWSCRDSLRISSDARICTTQLGMRQGSGKPVFKRVNTLWEDRAPSTTSLTHQNESHHSFTEQCINIVKHLLWIESIYKYIHMRL